MCLAWFFIYRNCPKHTYYFVKILFMIMKFKWFFLTPRSKFIILNCHFDEDFSNFIKIWTSNLWKFEDLSFVFILISPELFYRIILNRVKCYTSIFWTIPWKWKKKLFQIQQFYENLSYDLCILLFLKSHILLVFILMKTNKVFLSCYFPKI